MAVVRVTQLNVNNSNCLGKQANDIVEAITDETPDILFLCDTYHLNVKKYLPAGWSTNQQTSGIASKQESTVCWKTSMFTVKDTGLTLGVQLEKGKRYFSRVDLTYDGSTVRFASCNVPTHVAGDRDSEHRQMMGTLIEFIKNSKYNKVCVGGDFGVTFDVGEDPWNTKKRTGTTDRTYGGYGFILTPNLNPTATRTSSDFYTDHRAVSTTIDM